jgi:hypothetical protein
MKEILLATHFSLMCYMAFYPFLCKKSVYDNLYLLFLYIVVLHWTFYRECVLAYYYKRLEEPGYVTGSDPEIEFKRYFKGHDQLIDILSIIRNTLICIAIYMVASRNHIPFYIFFPFVLIGGLFILRHRFFNNCSVDKDCQIFLECLRYLLLLYALFVISIKAFPM